MAIGVVLKRAIRRMGYEIHRVGAGGEADCYIECTPYGYQTYAPWFEPWFQAIYREVSPHTVVKEDRCYTLYQAATQCLNLEGDFAEAGVFKGGTAMMLSKILSQDRRGPRPFHLFDTFEGMPEEADHDPSGHKKGHFGETSLQGIQRKLAAYDFVNYYPAAIPAGFPPVAERKFAFVHVDVDLYQATKESFGFFYPRVVRGGLMICDDYGFLVYKDAARKAVEEFFADKPERPIALRTGQCLVVKL